MEKHSEATYLQLKETIAAEVYTALERIRRAAPVRNGRISWTEGYKSETGVDFAGIQQTCTLEQSNKPRGERWTLEVTIGHLANWQPIALICSSNDSTEQVLFDLDPNPGIDRVLSAIHRMAKELQKDSR